MDEAWKKQLAEWKEVAQKRILVEQEKTHLGNYLRVRYGEENVDWEADKYECHDCGVAKGQIHVFGCDVEECPVCGDQLISCGHFSEYFPESQRSIYNSEYDLPAKKEYFIKFLNIVSCVNGYPLHLVFCEKNPKKEFVLFCDKVLIGETLKQAIKRALNSTFGISEVLNFQVTGKTEKARNKRGELLDRVVVFVEVKYEDVRPDVWSPYFSEWISQKELKERISTLKRS